MKSKRTLVLWSKVDLTRNLWELLPGGPPQIIVKQAAVTEPLVSWIDDDPIDI